MEEILDAVSHWNVVVLAVTSALWLERKKRIFEEVEEDNGEVWE